MEYKEKLDEAVKAYDELTRLRKMKADKEKLLFLMGKTISDTEVMENAFNGLFEDLESTMDDLETVHRHYMEIGYKIIESEKN